MAGPKAVYIAGTRQHEGKTVSALGLIGEFRRRDLKVGYIKPVGQEYVEVEGDKIDKDSLLIVRVFDLEGDLWDTSPIAVERDFTRNYIENPNPKELERRITEAYVRVADGKDVVVIEGTGHAGVGAVMDVHNARVAKILGASAIIVSSGGIGRPIDEFMLNQALFEQEGVPIAGVLVNKIYESKIDMIGGYLRKALDRLGVNLLGVMPEARALSRLTLRQVVKELAADILHGKEFLGNTVERLVIGAMTAHKALDYLSPGVLMITGGDRDDLVLAAAGASLAKDSPDESLAGIILTGGMRPHESIFNVVKKARFPLLLHEKDSYHVAARVHGLVAKIQVEDTAKHDVAIEMVRRHVDVDGLLERI